MTEGAALEHCTAETFSDDNVAIDAAFNGVAVCSFILEIIFSN